MFTHEQVKIALGIMSGRLTEQNGLRWFDDVNKLYDGELDSGRRPTMEDIRLKAEQIVLHVMLQPTPYRREFNPNRRPAPPHQKE